MASCEQSAERQRNAVEQRLSTAQTEFELALRREQRYREEEREQAQRDKVGAQLSMAVIVAHALLACDLRYLHDLSPVSIQTQSLALASSQSWLPVLRPSIPIGCLPTKALAFLAVFVYATHATQAIAFEWNRALKDLP